MALVRVVYSLLGENVIAISYRSTTSCIFLSQNRGLLDLAQRFLLSFFFADDQAVSVAFYLL